MKTLDQELQINIEYLKACVNAQNAKENSDRMKANADQVFIQ